MVQASDLLPEKQVIPASRWQVFFALAAFVVIGTHAGAFGVLLPSIRAAYQVNVSTLSWAFVASTLGYITASLGTMWQTRIGARRFLLLALGIFLFSSGLISLGVPFVVYLALTGLLGLGIGMIDAGLNAYLASLPHSTILLNYLHAFWGMGALIGPLLASLLFQWRWNWQATYEVWFVVTLLLSVGFWFFFRPAPEVAPAEPDQHQNLLLQTLRQRVLWLVTLFLVLYVGVEIGLGTWGYSFLTIARQGPVLESAWAISGYWLGLTVSRLTLANASARLGMRALMHICLVGVVVGLLLVWLLPGFWGAAPGLCLIGFFLGPIFPTSIALLSQAVPARLVASAVGFLFALSNVGGALFPSSLQRGPFDWHGERYQTFHQVFESDYPARHCSQCGSNWSY